MTIVIFGENCTGKSTLAKALEKKLGPSVQTYSGRDYLRLAKTEGEAVAAFKNLLQTAQNPVIYVCTEPDLLSLAPENAFRILVTAPLETIQKRFSARTGGTLPPRVAQMLKEKHGQFTTLPHNAHWESEKSEAEAFLEEVSAQLSL